MPRWYSGSHHAFMHVHTPPELLWLDYSLGAIVSRTAIHTHTLCATCCSASARPGETFARNYARTHRKHIKEKQRKCINICSKNMFFFPLGKLHETPWGLSPFFVCSVLFIMPLPANPLRLKWRFCAEPKVRITCCSSFVPFS